MSREERTTIPIMVNTITIDGVAWGTSRPMRVIFYNARSIDSDAVVVTESTDDYVIMGDESPISIKAGPTERSVHISAKLLKNEDGSVYDMKIVDE